MATIHPVITMKVTIAMIAVTIIFMKPIDGAALTGEPGQHHSAVGNAIGCERQCRQRL